jgi:hypothetical protein
MANTGVKNVLTLRKYVNGEPTSFTKLNLVGDPDYIAPYEDIISCPIGAEPPVEDTVMSHVFTDSYMAVVDVSSDTTAQQGDAGSFTVLVSAPSGNYWTSAPTFSSDTAGCTAVAVISANTSVLTVTVDYIQGADASTVTYTYSSEGKYALAPVESIDWSGGTSLNVSSSGSSPVTNTLSGTLTIQGSDKAFRAYVSNVFNTANIASISLVVDGTNLSVSTDGNYGTFYTAPLTKAAGTYFYTLTITLNLVGGMTSGAASGGIQNIV